MFNSTQMAARIQFIDDGNPKANQLVDIELVDFIQTDLTSVPTCDYKDRLKKQHTKGA